jgi:hypothetical protein
MPQPDTCRRTCNGAEGETNPRRTCVAGPTRSVPTDGRADRADYDRGKNVLEITTQIFHVAVFGEQVNRAKTDERSGCRTGSLDEKCTRGVRLRRDGLFEAR